MNTFLADCRFTEIKTSTRRAVLGRNDLMYNEQKGKCCYCERQMVHKVAHHAELAKSVRAFGHVRTFNDPRYATREHLQRQVEGGDDREGNLRLACYECNTHRGAMDWLTYKSFRMGELTFEEAHKLATENGCYDR